MNAFYTKMEVLLSLVVDDICEVKSDSFLLNLRKKRRVKLQRRLHIVKCSLKRKIPKNKSFFETIQLFSEDVFYSHFRMNWSTFECLKADLTPFWSTARTGRCGKSLDKCLYVTLWKLCNSRVTFRQLSDRFGIANGAAHYLFKKTIKVLCELKSEIKWPSVEQQQTIMTEFENSRENPFPFIIGCLDGTHFNIPTPSEDAISYYDRKGKHSVQMQAAATMLMSGEVAQYGITSGQLQLAPETTDTSPGKKKNSTHV
ncbi:uncharacterized protein LOC129249954 isoform X2 [Anastrepha obliqua]|uniref:uncharacterized protein LOC129249954 isoform X2 n=1 Tax=Anastrepha obliqua TaxID=95512 RepID=UPI002409178F|nr:uncharacterized protein LOC129249954 isoform X2 [Anastrepha obliqua]